MMRELPFGARIANSFVKKLKWETAQATEKWPDVMPRLCAEDRYRHEYGEGQSEGPPFNRLKPRKLRPVTLIKERVWILRFDRGRPPAGTIFEIDRVELHISEEAQAELLGSIIQVVDDKIVVTYDRI